MQKTFTERSRSVLTHAIDEAKRMGCHRVSPEHILGGILKENANIAAKILLHRGLDLRRVRLQIDGAIAQEEATTDDPSLCNMTERSEQLCRLANHAALELGDEDIDVGHLLIATIDYAAIMEPHGLTHHLLESMEIKPDDLRQEILVAMDEERPRILPRGVTRIENQPNTYRIAFSQAKGLAPLFIFMEMLEEDALGEAIVEGKLKN